MKKEENAELRMAIDLFKRTNRLHMRVFDKYVDTREVRRRPHHILNYLYYKNKNDVAVCQKEIAEHFEISTAAVAVTLKKLESMGFVQKSVNPNDSRFNSISITQDGIEVIERTRSAFWRIDTAMFEDMTDDELSMFSACLEKMHTKLKTMYETEDKQQ